MQGSLFLVVAAAIVLVVLLVWLNIMMVRRGKKQGQAESGAEKPRRDSTGKEPSDPSSDTLSSEMARQEPNHGSLDTNRDTAAESEEQRLESSHRHHRRAVRHGHAGPNDGTGERPLEYTGNHESPDVEVVQSRYQSRQTQGNKVFDRNPLPYFLHGASVPEFDSHEWHEVFMRLSEDPNVMGWVAFHEDTAGASDREYEFGFMDVLRSYRRSVASLQREVGLSQVLETSVVGEEGKIWFLTGSQEHWFALFVDRKADVHEIIKPFMKQLLSGE